MTSGNGYWRHRAGISGSCHQQPFPDVMTHLALLCDASNHVLVMLTFWQRHNYYINYHISNDKATVIQPLVKKIECNLSKMWSIPQEPPSDSGCHEVAMGLSPKPHGRFRSFLAGKSIWLSRHHMIKFITIRSIAEFLEGFFNFLGFHGNEFQFLWILVNHLPKDYIPAKYRVSIFNGLAVKMSHVCVTDTSGLLIVNDQKNTYKTLIIIQSTWNSSDSTDMSSKFENVWRRAIGKSNPMSGKKLEMFGEAQNISHTLW